MKSNSVVSLILMFLIVFTSLNLLANSDGEKQKKDKAQKKGLLVNPSQSLMNINNATMWVSEEGFHDWNVVSSWNGSFPNGTSVGSIFTEGILWGGKVNDGSTQIIRVNGNTYGTGCAPITRLFRVRTDYLTGDLTSDAASFFNIPIGEVTTTHIQTLRDQYTLDWNEWPVNEGAPFSDVDNNGIYNPNNDIPGIPGSSQTLFIKYNDDLSESNYASLPIGLKISETYWAYSVAGAIGNVIYKKVDLVYTGTPTSITNSQIDSMYIVQWADADVGNFADDFAGCDTTLNLGYAYNSVVSDAAYAGIGLAPPAVGYSFLQGVSKFTGNPSDSAVFNLQWQKRYKYVNQKPMCSFIYFGSGGGWVDPELVYQGALEFYRFMQGYIYPWDEFPDSIADYTPNGVYLLDGNPVNGTGKIDGVYDGAGDRRILGITGPFNLSLGDTAEVVIGLVFGLGSNNLNSITKLKENTISAISFFNNMVWQNTINSVNDLNDNTISSYSLNQNYPNPFNPSTKISWQSPVGSWQTLKVYDLLGNEVVTLVNEYRNAGSYEVEFKASFGSHQLANGVYFYQLRVGDPSSSSGQSFVETKKMILLK